MCEWLIFRWLLLVDNHIADFEQFKIDVHFTDFGQVRIYGHFANFGQANNWSYSKTTLGEIGGLSNFLGYLSMPLALNPGFSDLWRSPAALSSISTSFGCLLFLIVQASSLMIHPPFPTQSVRLPLVTYPSLCSTYVTFRTPCHASGHQVLPTQHLPREAEDFPRGGKHSKHVPLLTYLALL